MKYLLSCPACGTKLAVEAGQAGQLLACACGQKVEVPSIRALRQGERVLEDQDAVQGWSGRKGTAFLGGAIAAVALLSAGIIWVVRPAALTPSDLMVSIDQAAIEREVSALSPAESYAKFEMFEFPLPSLTAERLKSGSIEPQLLLSADLLVAFEGKGPQPLSPQANAVVAKAFSARVAEAKSREQKRRTMSDWLWLTYGGVAVGILIACSAIFVGKSSAGRPPGRLESRS